MCYQKIFGASYVTELVLSAFRARGAHYALSTENIRGR